ncbi:MAG: ribosome-associated translation inhibitor RaiA [Planctomycetales bacterium]
MEIKISARHGHLSERTQETVRAKVEKLSRVFDRLTEILVTVDLENRDSPKVDIVAAAEHKKDFKASEQGDRAEDLVGVVDAAVHKLEKQLRKYKQKIQEHHPH